MKRIKHSVLLASLLTLALTACTTERMGGASDTAGAATPDASSSAGYGTTGTGTGADTGSASTASGTSAAMGTGTSGSTDTMGAGTAGTATTSDPQGAGSQASTTGATGAMPNSVVTMIEVVPRSGAATGAGSMAGAAVGGTAGAGADRVYRITLRMDDGSTRVITQESAPTFRSGDRVNLSGGEIQRR